MKPAPSFVDLPDRQLLVELKRLAHTQRQATAALIACLAEVDARRLYLGEGCSSLFTYCTQVLHLSEHAAYGRIEAARAARRFPLILERVACGDLTLTAVCLLRPHLTEANYTGLLAAARHKSKRDIEQLVAAIRPKLDVPSAVRKVPQGQTPLPTAPAAASSNERASGMSFGDPLAAPTTTNDQKAIENPPPAYQARPAVVAPLAPERYKVQFTIGRETHDKLRRAQDLLRHAVPNGDPAEVFDRALSLLIEHLEKAKLASAKRPRASRATAPASRRIPAAVKRTVWRRDGGQCAFRGAEGRCTERGFLEFHHVVPYARGGAATAENVELRCRAHNQYEADLAFGAHHFLVREHPARDDVVQLGPDRARLCESFRPQERDFTLRSDESLT